MHDATTLHIRSKNPCMQSAQRNRDPSDRAEAFWFYRCPSGQEAVFSTTPQCCECVVRFRRRLSVAICIQFRQGSEHAESSRGSGHPDCNCVANGQMQICSSGFCRPRGLVVRAEGRGFGAKPAVSARRKSSKVPSCDLALSVTPDRPSAHSANVATALLPARRHSRLRRPPSKGHCRAALASRPCSSSLSLPHCRSMRTTMMTMRRQTTGQPRCSEAASRQWRSARAVL